MECKEQRIGRLYTHAHVSTKVHCGRDAKPEQAIIVLQGYMACSVCVGQSL